MTAIILNLIKNHWVGSLISIFAIGIAAKLSIQQLEISHLRGQLTLCNTENVTLEDSNKALINSVKNQNAAISTLQDEANRKSKNAAHALANAKANARKYAIIAEQLRATKNTGDECADMRSLVDNYIKTAP